MGKYTCRRCGFSFDYEPESKRELCKECEEDIRLLFNLM